MADTLDITPTWQGLVPTLVAVAANGTTAEARSVALGELMKLAKIVDERIGDLKRLRDEQEQFVPPGAPCPDCGIRGDHAYGCPISAKLAGEPDA